MAIDAVAYTISALSHSAELFRRASGAHLDGISGGSASGSGVKNSTDFAVTAGGGMSVNIAAGDAEVFGTLSNAQGPYYCHSASTVNAAIASSDPTNPRIDAVCITVNDSQYAGSTDSVVLQVITGTPAGSPVAPALPANSLKLADVLVPASSASVTGGNITDKRTAYFLLPTARVLPAGAVNTPGRATLAAGGDINQPGDGVWHSLGPAVTALIPPSGAVRASASVSAVPVTSAVGTPTDVAVGVLVSGGGDNLINSSPIDSNGRYGGPGIGEFVLIHGSTTLALLAPLTSVTFTLRWQVTGGNADIPRGGRTAARTGTWIEVSPLS